MKKIRKTRKAAKRNKIMARSISHSDVHQYFILQFSVYIKYIKKQAERTTSSFSGLGSKSQIFTSNNAVSSSLKCDTNITFLT